jgi:dihydrofolate synthase / folylpolyglutamate synthase
LNYKETLDYLFSRLPMFQRVGASAYKTDLNNTVALCKLLGNPEQKLTCIHVAGTNGKGSTSHMLASILQSTGLKVGLYTSPHLKDFRERIKINGKMIPKKEVVDFVEKHKNDFEKIDLSFFEWTVGLAFSYFAKQKVDIAIIEVGMGGRLDSTNVIKPLVSVITNIGMDHTQFLGDTLEKIAIEKAGIIKEKIPVVIGETQAETTSVFESKAKEKASPIFFADDCHFPDYTIDLKGNYQKKNVKTVLKTIQILQQTYPISETAIIEGLKNTIKNTGLLGRWQTISEKPHIICDTGHNIDGIAQVIEQLKTYKYKQLHIVLGMVADKDISKVLSLFPKKAIYYFCCPKIPRGLKADLLLLQAKEFGLEGKPYASVKKALSTAKKQAVENDLIFVGGSTFVVAEVV